MYEMAGKYDDWLAAHQKLFPNEPIAVWYSLATGRLEEAQKEIDERLAKGPNVVDGGIGLRSKSAMLFALKGDFHSAEALIPSILSQHPTKDPLYHHAAYDIACVYALEGKTLEAVKWLREATENGFQARVIEHDAYLNRIRQTPEFMKFMDEIKTRWDRYRQEFSDGVAQ
jgi:Flp pilus assembly protein TadD